MVPTTETTETATISSSLSGETPHMSDPNDYYADPADAHVHDRANYRHLYVHHDRLHPLPTGCIPVEHIITHE